MLHNRAMIHARFFKFLLAVGLFIIIALVYHLSHPGVLSHYDLPFLSGAWRHDQHSDAEIELVRHPIDQLVKIADKDFEHLLSNTSATLEQAAVAYRDRRGRHPPPAFDAWVAFAQGNNAIIVEDLFDQIYHDLEPFWAVPASQIHKDASTWTHVISIRNHSAQIRNREWRAQWIHSWHEMLQQIEGYLPDVDMAFNDVDEPRLFVPWEIVNNSISAAHARKHTNPPTSASPIHSEYSFRALLPDDAIPTSLPSNFKTSGPTWLLARETCPPDSVARFAEPEVDYSLPPSFNTAEYFQNSYHGYVANWTQAKSACENPHLRNLHGALVPPSGSRPSSKTFFPLFSGCKLQGISNDILVPGAAYWSGLAKFTGAGDTSVPWNSKLSKAVWRGQASGTEQTRNNWRYLHRHRFVAMLNGTQVSATEKALHSPSSTDLQDLTTRNFPLPNNTLFPLSASLATNLGDWVAPLADAAFVHLMCDPWIFTQFTEGAHCAYLDPYYHTKAMMPMAEQFGHKYLPDVDGYSYSGRYKAFLRSNSLPIKATLYAEWHDDRLLAWRHFVPMDNTFGDWWGILEYFLGYGGVEGGKGGVSDGGEGGMSKEEEGGMSREEEGGVSNEGEGGVNRRGKRRVKRELTGVEKKGHDDVAEKIAAQGMEWAGRVLRKEDLLVYMYRLVLEYARICDERRDMMGFVDDLVASRIR